MHRPQSGPENKEKGAAGELAQPPHQSRSSKRKTRFKCPTIIQQARNPGPKKDWSPANIVTAFEFYRFRFHFRALDPVHFPAGKSANIVRGAFGTVLREAVSPAV